MIDSLYVVSFGGVVLWQTSAPSHKTNTSRRTAVNHLIQDILLEDRSAGKEYVFEDLKLRWSLENDAQFVTIAVYPKFLQLTYVDMFLTSIKKGFAQMFGKVHSGSVCKDYSGFKKEYDQLLSTLDASERVDTSSSSVPGTMSAAMRGRAAAAAAEDAALDDGDDEEEETDAAHASARDVEQERGEGAAEPHGNQSASLAGKGGSALLTKDGRVIPRRKGARPGAAATGGAAAAASSQAETKPVGKRGKPGKAPTKWEKEVSDPMVAVQAHQPTEEELDAQADMQRKTFIKKLPSGKAAPITEHEWENQPRGLLSTWLRSYVGSRELDAQDFANVIPPLREKLIGKNVAVEVAEHVCKSVETSLAGSKLGTFDSLQSTIEGAMTAALRRILQPKHEVNVLRAAASAKARKKPFSIVLCGVNGVGKSTSLAKLSYWLQQNNFSVLVAAGDTFRHGAVEQLQVHGRCLGVPIFQMGYGADPSIVAASAIAQAARNGTDVVMIDTAGRMQDHESRMRALAKLIHDNQPDLVLFVGEALVGNNGVDQLRKFNQCLVDFAPIGGKPRGIDGIILTKFDTIDDKVGAALSMVYELGQPIVFVGVGQTYQDLKVLDPGVVVNALMR